MRVLEIEKKEGESTRKHRQMWIRFSTLWFVARTQLRTMKNTLSTPAEFEGRIFPNEETLDRKCVWLHPKSWR